MRLFARCWVWSIFLVLSLASAAAADDGSTCSLLPHDTRFIDPTGAAVDPVGVDAIAMREQDGRTVIVYRRTEGDAKALVAALTQDGETRPDLLDSKTWLLAQAPRCQMRPGNRCTGNCPGRQRCRRIKRPGRDVCTCVR